MAATSLPAFASPGTLALSQPGGPTGGGNTIVATIATAPTSPNPTVFNASTAVAFVAITGTAVATCPAAYGTPGATATAVGTPNVKVLSTSKIAILVPAGVVSTTTNRHMICAYGGNAAASVLIAGALYTVGGKPTIAATNGVSPATGPALGGTSITVTGTNFAPNTVAAPNNTTATLDGVALSNINVAANGLSFTATTPPHAPGGPFLLNVTTLGGSVNTLGATTAKALTFRYSNGIVISPNTAPNSSAATDVDVLGVGFADSSFEATTGSTPSSANAHVYLTAGSYNATGTTGAGLTGLKTSGPITECTSVLVISDTELLSGLALNRSFDTAAALTTVTSRAISIATVSGSPNITAVTGGFTAADIGLPIDNADTTSIPAGALITTVTSPTTATISVNSGATNATLAATNVGGPRSAAPRPRPSVLAPPQAPTSQAWSDLPRRMSAA